MHRPHRQRHLRRQRRVRGRRRRRADRGLRAGLGRRRGARRASTPRWSAGTPRSRRVVVTLGGDLVRLTPTVRYAGPGGDAELLGLYFADAGQHLEHRLFVDHDAPQLPQPGRPTRARCRASDAHAVWIGDVLIRAAAEGTDTYELNRNLVLTDGARADSVPNLEIETGEIVGAGHASATGRFDDEQLFYLMARGIPDDEARRLVVRGFFAEMVAADRRARAARPADRGDRARSWRPVAVTAAASSGVVRAVLSVAGGRPRSSVEVGDVPVCWSAPRARSTRFDDICSHAEVAAVRGRGRRRHGRVLAARLALRPAHRQALRACRPPAGAHLSRKDRRRRCARRPSPE